MDLDTDLILKHLTVLLVDDNYDSSAALYSLLSNRFSEVLLAHTAERALDMLAEESVDMIITDICLPGMDGLKLVEHIRQTHDSIVPVIVVTAHGDHDHLMRAANLQVDGLVIKPLNPRKLNSAMANAVKRLKHTITPVQLHAAVGYHPLHKTLRVDDREISLGSKECRLLDLLVRNRHQLVTKQEIYDSVWPNEDISESALKNLLAELRKKLSYNIIRNRHGAGWVLESRQT
ncbi:response regulator transcription factor [Marinobacter zhejiangensis]|nr:response regulator transcription factor [Marinobacter zhejiangensis]